MYDYEDGRKALNKIYDKVLESKEWYESGAWNGVPMDMWEYRDWQGTASHVHSEMDLTDEELSGILAYSSGEGMGMHEILGAGICALTGSWLQVIHEYGRL